MSSLPLISHHLFVAAIEEPVNNASAKLDSTDVKVIEVEVVDLTEPYPEPVARGPRLSRSSSKH